MALVPICLLIFFEALVFVQMLVIIVTLVHNCILVLFVALVLLIFWYFSWAWSYTSIGPFHVLILAHLLVFFMTFVWAHLLVFFMALVCICLLVLFMTLVCAHFLVLLVALVWAHLLVLFVALVLLSYVGPICYFDSCLSIGLLGGHGLSSFASPFHGFGLCSSTNVFHAQEEVLSLSTTQIH
jgi:hypothetical protein